MAVFFIWRAKAYSIDRDTNGKEGSPMVIRWTNKFSGETGFVKKINKKAGYFENTFVMEEAKSFTENTGKKALADLPVLCQDNTYELV